MLTGATSKARSIITVSQRQSYFRQLPLVIWDWVSQVCAKLITEIHRTANIAWVFIGSGPGPPTTDVTQTPETDILSLWA